MTQHGETTQRILEYLARNPRARNVEVAAELKLSPAYVSVVRGRHGIPRTPGAWANPLGKLCCGPAINAHEGLAMWLIRECPKGLTLAEFVASIILDAMQEDTNDAG